MCLGLICIGFVFLGRQIPADVPSASSFLFFFVRRCLEVKDADCGLVCLLSALGRSCAEESRSFGNIIFFL